MTDTFRQPMGVGDLETKKPRDKDCFKDLPKVKPYISTYDTVDDCDIQKEDVVHSPDHYSLPNGTEVIDIIEHLLTPEEYRGYLKGNILKYTLRADKKGEAITDRQKSSKYLQWLIEKEIEHESKSNK